MTLPVLVAFGLRVMLCILFFPFSALDKTLNFAGAVKQAKELVPNDTGAKALILIGLAVEIVTPLCIITGTADRAAAFVLGGYCAVTALLFKQFWAPGDFWQGGDSKGRQLFWDFLKNFSLAAGILLLTFGTVAATTPRFIDAPFASTHPYAPQTPRATP